MSNQMDKTMDNEIESESKSLAHPQTSLPISFPFKFSMIGPIPIISASTCAEICMHDLWIFGALTLTFAISHNHPEIALIKE